MSSVLTRPRPYYVPSLEEIELAHTFVVSRYLECTNILATASARQYNLSASFDTENTLYTFTLETCGFRLSTFSAPATIPWIVVLTQVDKILLICPSSIRENNASLKSGYLKYSEDCVHPSKPCKCTTNLHVLT